MWTSIVLRLFLFVIVDKLIRKTRTFNFAPRITLAPPTEEAPATSPPYPHLAAYKSGQ